MKQQIKIFGSILLASLVLGQAGADDKVDEALKGRDMNTIMNLLTVKQTEEAAAPAASNATTPAKPTSAANNNAEDLKALRERLAQELQAARDEARRSGLDVAEAPAAPAKTRTFEPEADKPVPVAATPKRSRGIFNKLFKGSGDKETPTATPEKVTPKSTPIEIAQVDPQVVPTTPIPAPVAQPAPAASPAPAIANPVVPKVNRSNPNDNAAAARTLNQPAPNFRKAQPNPGNVRSGMGNSANSVRQNRNALDSLIQQSRNDLVNMAMNQASGNDAAENQPEEDPDAWKKAGPNAWKYNGEWQNGTMHGQGRMTFADGWEYVGMWQNGLMHGQGTIVYPDGTSYEGQWRSGRMDGYGTLTYADGWKFVGQWRDGKISGNGTLVNPGN